jgi:hypothetical protein
MVTAIRGRKGISGLLALALCLLAASGCRKVEVRLAELIPREVRGWKALGRGATYDRKTLFDYIDGGAELYLSYRFRKLLAQRFQKAGQPDIIVDLFDLGSSEEAFGVFTAEREEPEAGIGQGSEYAAGLLRFWKDRFFVSVWAERETPRARGAVLALGAAIAKGIKSSGNPPGLVRLLPAQGLAAPRVRYFHDHHSLNRLYFVADQNILGLDKHTDAVLAPYRAGRRAAHLLLVRYPSSEDARRALAAFLSSYLPEGKQAGRAQVKSGTWVGARREGKLVAVVFDAPTRSRLDKLLEAVTGKSRGQKL